MSPAEIQKQLAGRFPLGTSIDEIKSGLAMAKIPANAWDVVEDVLDDGRVRIACLFNCGTDLRAVSREYNVVLYFEDEELSEIKVAYGLTGP